MKSQFSEITLLLGVCGYGSCLILGLQNLHWPMQEQLSTISLCELATSAWIWIQLQVS